MTQRTSFQSAVGCLESLLQHRIFPEYIKKGGKSLHRLGFTGQISGLATRPFMSRQSETMDAVFQYLRVQPNKKNCANQWNNSKLLVISRSSLFMNLDQLNATANTNESTRQDINLLDLR